VAPVFLSVKGLGAVFCREKIDERIPQADFESKSRLVGETELVRMGIVKVDSIEV